MSRGTAQGRGVSPGLSTRWRPHARVRLRFRSDVPRHALRFLLVTSLFAQGPASRQCPVPTAWKGCGKQNKSGQVRQENRQHPRTAAGRPPRFPASIRLRPPVPNRNDRPSRPRHVGGTHTARRVRLFTGLSRRSFCWLRSGVLTYILLSSSIPDRRLRARGPVRPSQECGIPFSMGVILDERRPNAFVHGSAPHKTRQKGPGRNSCRPARRKAPPLGACFEAKHAFRQGSRLPPHPRTGPMSAPSPVTRHAQPACCRSKHLLRAARNAHGRRVQALIP